MRRRIFLGFTKDDEIVFGEIEFNNQNEFTASFDVSYPIELGENEQYDYYENFIDEMDKEYIFQLLDEYNCAPSELAEKLVNDTPISETFDNSLYPEEFDSVEGVNETVYFLASRCGQADTRDLMQIYTDKSIYDMIHELWDKYHLKGSIDSNNEDYNKVNKLLDDIDLFNSENDEREIVENWLTKDKIHEY